MNVNRVKKQAAQYLSFDMIQQHTELPSFPDFQVQLLLAFLQPDLQRGRRDELYSLVLSLVQIGLDAHDEVSVRNDETEIAEMRSKQIKILAGDYLSGRYYELLAAAGEIDAVRRIAEAISDVNQMKISLYLRKQQRDLSGEQYLQQLLAIRTRLFLAFEGDVPEGQRKIWRDLLAAGTKALILKQEWQHLTELSGDYEGWAVWELLSLATEEDRSKVLAVLDEPEALRAWFETHRIVERLEAECERTEEELQQLTMNMRSEPLYEEAILPVIDDLRRITSRLYN
ncbi:hypothetical protein PRECH8_01770 [Insulibacter thermoxylanivorax]|uniref:Heptaprenyl diphosphate synthase n=1 Tax=Insulibacter thermoxylanivorax TaxID=2749268 RepID=A0A916Q9W2_9BACL|nr:heptaprenyl diphosphate synthase component 1 [Insulibacter thermoxylanivorax]GFR36881.1 hypothetical protein PRECH8_01770 [Insulibacter thermoxylanivorax]